MSEITITVDGDLTLDAELNESLSAATLADRLPLEFEMTRWGDEYYGWGETLDGYSVVRDPGSGMLSYARLADDGGTLVSTGVAAGESPPADLAKHVRIDEESLRTRRPKLILPKELRSPYGAGSEDHRHGG